MANDNDMGNSDPVTPLNDYFREMVESGAMTEEAAREEQEIEELFPADPNFLRKRMAVESMHEAGQFVRPEDFDLD